MGSGKEFYDFELCSALGELTSHRRRRQETKGREKREKEGSKSSPDWMFLLVLPSTSSPLSSFPLVACGTGINAQFTGNIALVLPSKCECQWSLTFSTMSVICGALDQKG